MTDRADRVYEQVLALRCQAGDGAAFEELVARYGPRLRYYVRKMPLATVLLLLASRRATLRHINAGLIEIGEQLKQLRQPPG